ncbi:hypothetical protein [Pseudonocardia acaciae]|uniref:hypothetical protein n=1 Tax=Pseudonocardia acaciae TaxID=551276 RepID=UPI00056D385B|nr:hypothetical protein [Pseudonocardia acaciae]
MSGEHEPRPAGSPDPAEAVADPAGNTDPAENPGPANAVTDPAENAAPAEALADPAEVAARRRRLAEVFGDVLPDATGDDAPDTVTRDDRPADLTERWYSENRPPHHDKG